MKKIIVLFFLVAMLMMATNAMATVITGEINFNGTLTLIGGASLATATGIDFTNPAYVAQTVSGTFGVIPALPTITPVTFTDFTYSPFVPSIIPLWTLTYNAITYSFDLSSVSGVTASQIFGKGVMHATGFDDTEGFWTLTTQQGTGVMSFSSSSTAVPEPGILLLLGTGFAGLAFYARRKKQ